MAASPRISSIATARTARPRSGDVLIGADGIHSFVREKLFPNEGPAHWNGTMLWRGAVDWPQFWTGRSMAIAGGMEAKFVLYPIGAGTAPDRRLTNWAVMAKVSEGGPPPAKEDWSRPGRWEDLGPHLKRFRLPYVDVSHLIEATGEFWEYPLCDRDPLPRWSHGRVTLLGDAAHPMYPVGSNGASQAILDARCLGDWLARAEHPMHALAAYEAERLPPTAQIVRMNRKGGPEGVIDAVETLAPDGFGNIDDVLSLRAAHGDRARLCQHGGVRAGAGEQAGEDRVARIEHADGRRPAAGVIRRPSSMRRGSWITPRRVFDAPRLHPGYGCRPKCRSANPPCPARMPMRRQIPGTGAREFG